MHRLDIVINNYSQYNDNLLTIIIIIVDNTNDGSDDYHSNHSEKNYSKDKHQFPKTEIM